MRIVSLQPSATEIVFALGLGDCLVGRSHRCDQPDEVVAIPVVTEPARPSKGPDPASRDSAGPTAARRAAADDAAARRAAAGRPGAAADDRVDLDLIDRLEPDLVLAAGDEDGGRLGAAVIREGLRRRHVDATVVGLDPRSVEGTFNSITTVGAFAEAEDEAIGLVELLREQLGGLENRLLERRLQGIASRRVVVLEGLLPPTAAARWVPELVRRAGGWDLLGREGEGPEATTWERLRDVEPEILVLALREHSALAAEALLAAADLPDWFDDLAAVREGQCYAVDGDGLLLRPGPRIVDAVAVLAELFDPEGFAGAGPTGAWIPLSPVRHGGDPD